MSLLRFFPKTSPMGFDIAPAAEYGPMCRCGARNTARIGDSALVRQCQACGCTYRYLLKDGILIPTALETALALEGK